MKKEYMFLITVEFFLMLFPGCASKPKLSGKGKLCGIVIDENNYPVSDFIISCRRDRGIWRTTITNEEGMFFYEDLNYGFYSFKGSKECFLKFFEQRYVFNNPTKVFCFQISSIDKVLDNVEEMIIYEDYENALNLLDRIECKSNLEAEKVVSFYREFISNKKEQENESES